MKTDVLLQSGQYYLNSELSSSSFTAKVTFLWRYGGCVIFRLLQITDTTSVGRLLDRNKVYT